MKEQIEDFVQDGAALAAEYKKAIHEEAVNPQLRIGRLRTEFLPALPARTKVTTSPSGSLVVELALRRHEVMASAIQTFPSKLKTPEVRSRLTKALGKHGFTMGQTRAEDRATTRAMQRAGYAVSGFAGTERVWSKQSGQSRSRGKGST